MNLKEIGPWTYILGVLLALIMGFIAPADGMWALILGILGLLVGLLNVTDKEVNMFLLASIAFIVAASSLSDLVIKLGAVTGIADAVTLTGGISSALNYMVAFTAPAAALIAVLALYRLSKD